MSDIKWVGPKVDCYNPALEKGWCDFYKSFLYKGEQFDIGEFAIITSADNPKARVGRLLCVYHSHEKWHRTVQYRGTVRWYPWAKDLDSKINIHRIRFDRENEVIEDMRSTDVFISLRNIQKKCHVLFGMADDPVHLIKNNSLNTDCYFSCRYKIEYGQIVPYFSNNGVNSELCSANEQLGYTELASDWESSDFENNAYLSPKKLTEASPIIKVTPIETSPSKLTKYKRKPSHMNTPILLLDSEGSDLEDKDVDKIQSLSNPLKNVRLTPKSKGKKLGGICSPSRKRNSSVKRVLNDSFGSPLVSPSGIPIRSYSVVDQDNDGKYIKMKFKLAGNQNSADLKVFPTKLDDEIVSMKSPIKVHELLEIRNRIELSPNRKPQMSDAANFVDSLQDSEQVEATHILEKIGTPKRKSSRCAEKVSHVEHSSPHGTPARIGLPRRRSSRTLERKSYAEFELLEETSPKKRIRRTSTDSSRSTRVKTPFREIIESKLLNKIEEHGDSSANERFKVNEFKKVELTASPYITDTHKSTINKKDNIKNMETSPVTPRKTKVVDFPNDDSDTDLTPRQKRNRSCPKRYFSNDEENNTIQKSKAFKQKDPSNNDEGVTLRLKRNNDKVISNTSRRSLRLVNSTDGSTPEQKGKVGSKTSAMQTRSVGRLTKHTVVVNECSSEMLHLRRNLSEKCDSDYSDSSNNEQLTFKQKRNVSRPKKYADNYELCSASPRRSSSLPTKYASKSIGVEKSVSKQKHKINHSGKATHVNNSIEDIESLRPKRSINRPKKYINNDEYDSSESKNHSKRLTTSPSKPNQNSPSKYRPAMKSPYSTPSVNGRNLRKSVLKSTSNKVTHADSDEDDLQPRTPRRGSTVSTPKSNLKTPTARAKMIREGIITPSVQARQRAIVKVNTPLSKARTQLHVSYVPKALPCREKEFADIINFLEGKLLDGCGGCMYVSGVPGTGKTATVTEIIRILQESAENGDVPAFKYVNINGMRLSEPRQSYVEIVKQLLGKTVPWEQAQTMLENKFVKSQKKSVPIILVVDELDILCTKRQDVVYNLLDWPTKAHAQLIVITIANTMDLPERLLMGRVTSRLGLTRLTFQAYTHKQLQEIVTKRLSGINAFNPDAIQLVARKVASVSGDARRALDICRRAAEIAELEGNDALVSMIHVNKALNAMITQPKVQAIKRCSRLEKLVLQAVVAEVERTGVEETNFASVLMMLVSLAVLDGFQMVSNTIAMAAVARLSACRLLLTDQKCNNVHQRLILNVSADDVYYALTKTDV